MMVLCMLDDSSSCALAVIIATGGPHLVDTGGFGCNKLSFLATVHHFWIAVAIKVVTSVDS